VQAADKVTRAQLAGESLAEIAAKDEQASDAEAEDDPESEDLSHETPRVTA
jgi:hypothetical protein